jgi:segregation and condensation protein B
VRGNIVNQIEAILFVAEKPVSRGEIAKLVGATPRQVDGALAELAEAYSDTGLRLAHDNDDWQIVTAPEQANVVAAYLGADRLRVSPASLETLAVVAYRQPVTRAEVEAIRGVNCDQTIYTLMQRRLIEERGRREAPGRPILYGTTWEFLECFGLSSLDQLPRALTPEGAIPGVGPASHSDATTDPTAGAGDATAPAGDATAP